VTSAAPPHPRAGPAGLPGRSTWVLVGKGVQMVAGFAFWVVAARSLSLSQAGVTAAACSAVMLCTQLAVLGTGSAVIVRVGRRQPPAEVLDLALTIILLSGVMVAGGYLAITATVGGGELVAGHVLLFATVFTVAAVTGTVTICLDQASIALGHAGGSVARYSTASVLSTGSLLALTLTSGPGELGALAAFACWSLGGAASTAVGLVQLRRWTGYRYHPAFHPPDVLGMLRLGVPHQLLTVSERLTPALVPLVLAYAASPATTAQWYPAWMMAWVVFTAPLSVGLVQFSDGVASPAHAARVTVIGLRWSLVSGAALAVPLALLGGIVLHVMGDAYTGASLTALRILLLGLLPMAVLQAYNAACRVTGRQAEAVALGLATTVAVCLSAAVFADRGVAVVAGCWVGAMGLASLVAAGRLPVVLRAGAPARHRDQDLVEVVS
jgi:O-antigen/teichoic acid export membrane protein